ncbi:MAG: ARPP-1 family domain-containing protein [Pyrinomonadaceae bacterium]
MKYQLFTRLFAGIVLSICAVGAAFAQTNEYRLSSAYTHKNLTIFLIHGKDESKKTNMMTLQEAMERKLFRVYETSEVNELEVENLSKELDVFIQAGDIVKGGKQDRVLAISIIIPARSGRVKIEAFCVESGRWQKRGNEDSTKFDSSNERVVTKELKIAANATRSQAEVWNKVSDAQVRLAKNVGGSVADGRSASSLQLSLEDKKVVANIDEYVKALSGVINGKSDVIGYAFAINGKINSADIYVSNSLFKKLWMKNLKATATEAVAESRGVRLAEPVKAGDVKGFMDDSEKAKSREQSSASGGARLVTREDKDNVMVEARDEKSKAVVHKSYVKKN